MTKRRRWVSHADLSIIKKCSIPREEYLNHMTFSSNSDVFFTELFGPLVGLKEEWDEQGATPGELDFSAYSYRCPMTAAIPVSTGWLGGEEVTLEETSEHRIILDRMQRKTKLFKGRATIPLPMNFPVKDMDDWLKIKHHYSYIEERFDPRWLAIARERLKEGNALSVGIPGGFDEPRQLLGEERLCISYYEDPTLIHDILDAITSMTFRVLERITSMIPVDILTVHEDMAGKSGPLIGPKHVREFITPYYKKIWDMLRDRGARLFMQDSDGNMNPVIQAFIDAGVNCIHPLEPAAGMDMVKIRAKYGNMLAFIGGLDKYALMRSKEAIISELEYKIPPMIRTGGCVLGLDHRIPNGTPLENYRFYVKKAWEIIEREYPKSAGR